MAWWKSYLCAGLILSLLSSCTEERVKEIRRETRTYEKAYNSGDYQKFEELWDENAEYVDAESGETIRGRAAIVERFRKNQPSQIEVEVDTISFPSEHKVRETGTVKIRGKDGSIKKTAYRAFYEKKNNKWLLTEVREVDYVDPPSHYEKLKELEWLVGDWIDRDEDVEIETHTDWDKQRNFLTQHFTVKTEGKFDLEGKQIIFWDPHQEKIRSWIFDSDGGFAEGSWSKNEKSWIVESSHTLPDGSLSSSTNIYTPIDENSYQWESTGREAGGELLPDIAPVKVIRKR